MQINKDQLVDYLDLEPLDEGGFFRKTYSAEVSSIYYLLTEESPIGLLHINKSDIVHFYHMGGSIEYTLISPDGEETRHILGSDLKSGEELLFLCPGGYMKAARLISGSYCLLSEMVIPAFRYEDRDLVTAEMLIERFPQFYKKLSHYLKKQEALSE